MIMRCLSPSPGTPQGRASLGESHALTHTPSRPARPGVPGSLLTPHTAARPAFLPRNQDGGCNGRESLRVPPSQHPEPARRGKGDSGWIGGAGGSGRGWDGRRGPRGQPCAATLLIQGSVWAGRSLCCCQLWAEPPGFEGPREVHPRGSTFRAPLPSPEQGAGCPTFPTSR